MFNDFAVPMPILPSRVVGTSRQDAATPSVQFHLSFRLRWWNLHGIACYLRNNAPSLVNFGARYRKGLPISSSIAESAVNQVVSLRMAKKRQMRWTDAGAHHLVQVRVAVLNGELSPSRLARLGRPTTMRSTCQVSSEVTQRHAA